MYTKFNFTALKLSFYLILFLLALLSNIKAEIIKKITVTGNDRISVETILLFSEAKIDQNINNDSLNSILKNLYETNFFRNVSVNLNGNNLIIDVDESPIIDKIQFEGIKSDRMKDDLNKIVKLKSRSSYNDFLISKDRNLIKNYLKNIGYYFAEIDTSVESLENNLVNVKYEINLGNKAKIKKISFLGDKIYKDSKLRSIIVSGIITKRVTK